MTAPLQPVAAVLPLPLSTDQGAPAATVTAATAVAAAASAAAVQPALPMPPVAAPVSSVQWSAQTLQNLKLQAFEHLIAQLALQIQDSPGAPAATWPTQGLPAATQQLLHHLLEQIQVTVQGQTQPLQLLAAQQGSAPLMRALVQTAADSSPAAPPRPPSSVLQTAAALSATAAVALEQAGHGSRLTDALLRLPQLQNWLVQQGTLVSPQGERGFALTLQVPVAWAQAVGAALQPVSTAAAAAVAPGLVLPMPPMALRLPVADLDALRSGPLALVLQPQLQGQAQVQGPASSNGLATSALLWLELQPGAGVPVPPVAAAASTALPLALPAPALAQEVQLLLQNKSDPWLMMAAAQAANALPGPRRSSEYRSHLCPTEGCQYQGLAPCAQPFCSEMNRIWAASGVARSG